MPLFVLGYFISTIDFSVLWRYFTWANQMTAMVMLWTAAGYLYRYHKFHWVASLPAWFITTVCATYLFYNKNWFRLRLSAFCVSWFSNNHRLYRIVLHNA